MKEATGEAFKKLDLFDRNFYSKKISIYWQLLYAGYIFFKTNYKFWKCQINHVRDHGHVHDQDQDLVQDIDTKVTRQKKLYFELFVCLQTCLSFHNFGEWSFCGLFPFLFYFCVVFWLCNCWMFCFILFYFVCGNGLVLFCCFILFYFLRKEIR